ncbi:MAG: hypothetical protein A3D94_14315 [Alphaproteobacteria bacterium RIFCSPHIGHO2_12_FULL_66_14]|nr:MAG: hypothetical protein A3D94_14315 [Alphaproteobacteria bacterium RIFCSPHIGHO2_12_FULL_66_14]
MLNNARWCDAVCRAHGKPGRFLPHMWVNAEAVPRFYPNVVTLQSNKSAAAEQREAIDILVKSNLPGRWSVKDSFRTLDLSRQGFEPLFEARWIRNAMPAAGPSSDIVWQRETNGAAGLPFGDPDFALFTGRRGFRVVAGGMLYRAEGVVGLSNVVADAPDARAVWRSLALLAAQTFPRLPLVGYESGDELKAASDAGFEVGDKLRIWVRSKD